MEPLKNIYNTLFLQKLAQAIKTEYIDFHEQEFIELAVQDDWEELALKERMRRITISLHKTIPLEYTEVLDCFYKAAPKFTGLAGIIFPDYVEVYGREYWEESISALEYFTEYSTSEFAVRPYLLLDQTTMLDQMKIWAKSENEHIRRLASEGCRPRLPWGMSIPALKKDPFPILPILEMLKADESLYVRKSVANSLNDISKTHPDLMIEIAQRWYGHNPHTNWIIKHASRTLLKKGDIRALRIFGYQNSEGVEITDFICRGTTLRIGESLNFSFQAASAYEKKLRIEYAIDYVKANGKRNRKVFHLSETVLHQGEKRRYEKTHVFKDLTTRKHYAGMHTLTIFVNGERKKEIDFEVEK
ncbi:DNA alkylation repair protein [Niallia nealsonii]|uniref:DNA alkylation repair enzyme n=1 Tax=Niallia nealsonii TaxID=115979 RepID=A0A2N0Z7N5_9BACI|nr:DNA alkylation repair protein [Niallia nealsonii]PKG25494.1 hypothetical protein CWS01_01220 [Niallia nealsonii]